MLQQRLGGLKSALSGFKSALISCSRPIERDERLLCCKEGSVIGPDVEQRCSLESLGDNFSPPPGLPW